MRIVRRALGLLLPLALLAPFPAEGASRIGQFVFRCTYSHTLADDPIVFPGRPGCVAPPRLLREQDRRRLLHGELAPQGGHDLPHPERHRRLLGADAVPEREAAPAAGDADLLLRRPVRAGRDDPARTPDDRREQGGHVTCREPPRAVVLRPDQGQRTPLMDTPYDCWPWKTFGFVDGVIALIEMPSCWNGVGLTPGGRRLPGRSPMSRLGSPMCCLDSASGCISAS